MRVVEIRWSFRRHVLSRITQLNEAVVITRGRHAGAGRPLRRSRRLGILSPNAGAIAGWLAMITPALLIIPLPFISSGRRTGTSTGKMYPAGNRSRRKRGAVARGGNCPRARCARALSPVAIAAASPRAVAHHYPRHALDYSWRASGDFVVGGESFGLIAHFG